MSNDGKKEDILWADIVLSCEYKKNDGGDDASDDVQKCLWSMQHVMRDDPRHQASFGMTIENSTTRLWFCCRSSVAVSEAFDFINEPENLVKFFAAFAFADQKSLPSQNKKNPRRFRTSKILSSYGAEPLRGRGTRVFVVLFDAVEIDKDGTPIGSPVVLKDTWIDNDRKREGSILDSIHAAAEGDDRQLAKKRFLTKICDGDVWTEPDILDDTANGLMRELNITADRDSLFKLQQNPFIQNNEPPSGSEGLRLMSRVRAPHPHLKYAHKTHYRIVFKEKGVTIDHIKSLPEVMTLLTETVSALWLLRKLGWVHRDVSIGNILSYDGHAKLADLEYAKKMSDSTSHEMRTGTMHFMSIEVAAQRFLFTPSLPRFSLTEVYESVSAAEKGEGTAQTKAPFSHNHLHDLESLWWVVVWVVFHNYFSKVMSSCDRPSFTLRDVEEQLNLARTLFPPVLNDTTHRDGFQESFEETCNKLPCNKKAICARLDGLCKLLINHYSDIEAKYPLSVDVNASKDDVYDGFT